MYLCEQIKCTYNTTIVAEFGDSRRKRRQSPKSATTVASVDRALRHRPPQDTTLQTPDG